MDGLLTLFWRFGLAVADIIIRATPACPYLAAVWSGVSPYCKTIKEIRFYCPLWKVFKSRCYNSTLFTTFQFEISMLKCGIKNQWVKAFKMRRFKGCYKWDLSLLNLAPFLFVLITSKPIINIEASISANHDLLFLEKNRQIQKGQVSFIASLKMSHFLIFNNFQVMSKTFFPAA